MTYLKTPILFLVFNRPEKTKAVFDQIRKAKPESLFIACDGPRQNNLEDNENVREVRDIVNQVNWDCEVHTLFREANLGCGHAVSEAITWFFEKVDYGIILEDDCLPSQSFFRYCEVLLQKFEHDTRIMKICGYNFYEEQCENEAHSYLFSHFGFAWGWATWRRAWSKFDLKMNLWDEVRQQGVVKQYPFFEARNEIFRKCRNNEIDTWDYQWDFAIAINSGLAIIPKKNLIQNIGFGQDATHTKNEQNIRGLKKSNEISFPLSHPNIVFTSYAYETAFMNEQKLKENTFFSFIKRVANRLKQQR